jgi:myo-inositol-1(or 4)-monophosphatase
VATKDKLSSIVTDLRGLASSVTGVAQDAGIVALRGFGGHLRSRPKGRFDVQIDADIDAENAILPQLRNLIPDSEIASEETTAPIDWDKANVWVVDPLDGTNNYYAAIPYLAISIALRQHHKLVLAVVHDPILKHSYTACLGAGAWRNGQRFDSSPPKPIERATVSLITNYSSTGRRAGERLYLRLSSISRRVTTLWAPAADLVRTATGHIDGIVCLQAGYGDVCSGLLILAESGGTILGRDGQNLDVANLDPQAPVSFVASKSYRVARDLWLELESDLRTLM